MMGRMKLRRGMNGDSGVYRHTHAWDTKIHIPPPKICRGGGGGSKQQLAAARSSPDARWVKKLCEWTAAVKSLRTLPIEGTFGNLFSSKPDHISSNESHANEQKQ